jgi:hypothetical protein
MSTEFDSLSTFNPEQQGLHESRLIELTQAIANLILGHCTPNIGITHIKA